MREYEEKPKPNPYKSPTTASEMNTVSGQVAWWSIACAGLLPLVLLVEYCCPQFRMPATSGGDALTIIVFVITAISIPTGVVGLRSLRWRLVLIALALGTAETVLIYYLKFHPVIMRDFL